MEPSDQDQRRSGQLAAVRAYCQAHPQTVMFDEPGEALFDVPGVKTLPLRAADLAAVETLQDQDTHQPYLRLTLGDGRQFALTAAGIALAPDFRNTGPLEDLPAAVCFRDYRGLLDRLRHDLYGHADEPPTRATVKLMMMCLAIVDGARALGFDVGREERELETHLDELEKRAPPPAP